jgi:hypothetical protein
MTYKDLLAKLSALSEEQLGQTVTVYNADYDEVCAASESGITGTEPADEICPAGVLDDGHFYLIIGI